MGTGRVTLQTVADQVGVSRMTVSNAFSRPDQLSETLRQRILAVADELGYCGPDPAGRALAKGATGAIGVLMSHSLSYAFRDEVTTGFLGAVADALAPAGLSLTLVPTVGCGELVPARDVPMDGALVYSAERDSEAVEWLSRRGLPLVLVDQAPHPRMTNISVDDRNGARAAAQHLLDLGHRRIGIVTAESAGPHHVLVPPDLPSGHHVARQRMLGWRDALEAAGVEPLVTRSVIQPEESAYRSAQVLLQRPDRPTAILCWSDVMAHWTVRAAEDLGLRVPEDLSVVGFDDNPLARRTRPELTTVRQDVAAKGRAAATALTRAIERERAGASAGGARTVLLSTELVVRDSTGPAPR